MITKRVLLIDDEKQLNKVVQMCLQKIGGWVLLVAESGVEGLNQAISQQPDAILLDIMMPDMDGLAVLQQLKTNPITQQIPVILFTAKVPLPHQTQYVKSGIVGIIPKPFNPLTLVEQIANLLEWNNGAT